MTRILLPIRPRFLEDIAAGLKDIEVRRNKPSKELPIEVFMYRAKGKPKPCDCDFPHEFIDRYGGKVVGRFILRFVEEACINPWNGQYVAQRTRDFKEMLRRTRLEEKELLHYIKGSGPFFLWHVSDLQIFDEPLELSDFITTSEDHECRRVTYPPQSWLYVDLCEERRTENR